MLISTAAGGMHAECSVETFQQQQALERLTHMSLAALVVLTDDPGRAAVVVWLLGQQGTKCDVCPECFCSQGRTAADCERSVCAL